MVKHESQGGTDTLAEERVKVKKPRLYKVLLLNDDYTSMDFVVMVLEQIFRKSPAEAVRIMLQVHNKGHGVCGIFPKEIAETKVDTVHRVAQDRGFPLRSRMEEE